MTLNRKLLKDKISSIIDNSYNLSLGDDDLVIFSIDNAFFRFSSKFRIQFNRLITYQGFSGFSSKKIEEEISKLISEELQPYYVDYFYFTPKDFYETDYNFKQEILSEEHLDEFLNEFVKCLEYHEKEVFPKLLDINFLAEYVGSVPFERKAEVAVGGSFPVHLFKKMAILKWGNQNERYLEYKKGTMELIEKYAIKKPDKYTPEFKEGFDQLVNHLESGPNPFMENII